uniref:Uncharacterized protein n=1 Tax=Ananas comosus var. bracteatus TaxID=296719 RepID=A0A6V7PMU5_ANACO|nr:unnamed protein product [Ananas comosus var. bracteatus]
MLDDIHNHWKRAEAVRIKCLGCRLSTWTHVCFHLEDKTGGKSSTGKSTFSSYIVVGPYYDPKQRPVVPLMLWKPLAPIYPSSYQMLLKGKQFDCYTRAARNGVCM